MSECAQSSFEFAAKFSRSVVADFSGSTTTSDGGALLLRQTAVRLNLMPRLAACFRDGRDQRHVRHELQEMVAQLVYWLALGYRCMDIRNNGSFSATTMAYCTAIVTGALVCPPTVSVTTTASPGVTPAGIIALIWYNPAKPEVSPALYP